MPNDSAAGGEQSFRLRWTLAFRDDCSLSPMAKLVGWTLASHMNSDGGSCYPSVERIGSETGLSRSAVKNGRRELVLRGYLRVDLGGGGRKTNSYQASFPSGSSGSRSPGDRLEGHAVTGTRSPGDPELVSEPVKEPVSPVCSADDVSSSPRVLDEVDEDALSDLLSEIGDTDLGTERTFRHHFGALNSDDFDYAAEVLKKRRNGTSLVDEPIESEAGFAFSVLSNLKAQRPVDEEVTPA